MVKDSEPGYTFWLHHLLTTVPRASELTSLSLSFDLCKVKMMTSDSRVVMMVTRDHVCRTLNTGPGGQDQAPRTDRPRIGHWQG